MKQALIISFIFLFINNIIGQTQDEILEEAFLLYNSEKASWHGTDIFLEEFPEKTDLIGGYLSYSENNNHSCIFFDNNDHPYILAKITFDSSFNFNNTTIDTNRRELNDYEMDLYSIRKIALYQMNHDTMFKQFNNCNLNPIPIITEKEKKVFVLTGPTVSGIVILGNDYLITFNKDNSIKVKRSLHKNILLFEYDDETIDATTMHSHVKSTGNFITSTDICTIMLYEKYAHWKQHIVVSKKNVSIWDCEKDQLLIMTKKAWDKISNHYNEKN